MKPFLFALIILGATAARSQNTEKFYDYNWKPCEKERASYYSNVTHTDSGWLRRDYFIYAKQLQMQALYADEDCKFQNGYAYYFYANGKLSRVGKMLLNKKEGPWISYHSNGMMRDSAVYHDDVLEDTRLSWHRNGYLSDSLTKVDEGKFVEVGWYDNGSPSFAGYSINGKKTGTWKYFHHNGQLSATELYDDGILKTAEYFQEDGTKLVDTTLAHREHGFKKGKSDWQEYIDKKLYWPNGYNFNKEYVITVGIEFTIDVDGKVKDAEVSIPFHPAFDEIALTAVKNSPNWIPEVEHNRKIVIRFTQLVSFSIRDD